MRRIAIAIAATMSCIAPASAATDALDAAAGKACMARISAEYPSPPTPIKAVAHAGALGASDGDAHYIVMVDVAEGPDVTLWVCIFNKKTHTVEGAGIVENNPE